MSAHRLLAAASLGGALIALPLLALAQEDAPAAAKAPASGPSQPLAQEAADAAVRTCERMGYKTMATVVDTSGRPVAARTADPQLNDTLASGSVKHAALAAEFHEASSDVAQKAGGDAGIYYTVHNNPRLSPVEPGGVPLTGPENPKGAIGVAGADGVKNEACAKAGADQVASRLK